MHQMQDDQIREMIVALDHAIPKLGAKVQMAYYGGGPGEERIVANKLGFLRLGIEFLRAAYAQPIADSRGCEHVADIGYLLTDDSAFVFDCIKRNDDL